MTQNDRAFAMEGPAFAQVERLGPIDWPGWDAAAARLARDLAGAADLPRRIHHLYLPVLFFCAAQARQTAGRPCLVGIQAPQGAGKTTLVTHLLRQLPELGLKAHGRFDRRFLPHPRGTAQRGGVPSRQPVSRTPRIPGHT